MVTVWSHLQENKLEQNKNKTTTKNPLPPLLRFISPQRADLRVWTTPKSTSSLCCLSSFFQELTGVMCSHNRPWAYLSPLLSHPRVSLALRLFTPPSTSEILEPGDSGEHMPSVLPSSGDLKLNPASPHREKLSHYHQKGGKVGLLTFVKGPIHCCCGSSIKTSS